MPAKKPKRLPVVFIRAKADTLVKQLLGAPHLIEQLNQGLQLGHKLTLLSAPAGYGQGALISEWAGNLRLDALVGAMRPSTSLSTRTAAHTKA